MNDKTDKNEKTGASDYGAEHEGLARLAESDETQHYIGSGTRLRNYFLTGLIIVGPISITVYIIWGFIHFVDAWVKPLIPAAYNPETYLPFALPGAGLIFAVLGIIIIGALTANLFGRTLVSYGETIVDRMPVVRNVYNALKQIFETVLSQSNTSFKKVGLIEYPRKGIYSICFIATDTSGELREKWPGDDEPVSVFLPTTPNPTSGYLLFVPRHDIVVLDMTVEEGAKLVISAGLVTPKYHEKLKELAKDARSKRVKAEPAAKKPAPAKSL